MSDVLSREQVERACIGLLNDAAIKGQIGLTTTIVLLSANDAALREKLRLAQMAIDDNAQCCEAREQADRQLAEAQRDVEHYRNVALDLQRELAEVRQERDEAVAVASARAACAWVQDDDDSDAWGTQCRRMFILIDGTPEDNKMKFCCYCGKPLVEETR